MLSPSLMAHAREYAKRLTPDKVRVYTRTVSAPNEHGEEVFTYTAYTDHWGWVVKFRSSTPDEEAAGSSASVQYAATLRLPYTVTVPSTARVKLLVLALRPLAVAEQTVFRVAGPAHVGPLYNEYALEYMTPDAEDR